MPGGRLARSVRHAKYVSQDRAAIRYRTDGVASVGTSPERYRRGHRHRPERRRCSRSHRDRRQRRHQADSKHLNQFGGPVSRGQLSHRKPDRDGRTQRICETRAFRPHADRGRYHHSEPAAQRGKCPADPGGERRGLPGAIPNRDRLHRSLEPADSGDPVERPEFHPDAPGDLGSVSFHPGHDGGHCRVRDARQYRRIAQRRDLAEQLVPGRWHSRRGSLDQQPRHRAAARWSPGNQGDGQQLLRRVRFGGRRRHRGADEIRIEPDSRHRVRIPPQFGPERQYLLQ